ncbi:MAG: HIT family protein [Minisyncoccia bacterium]
MDDCIFCKIVRKEIPATIIHETDDFLAFVNTQPVNFGHSLVIPKQHHSNIYDLPKNILEKLGEELQTVSIGIKKATNAEGINVDMNNEPAAGQVIFHAHFHIIPRFEGDGFKHWQPRKYEYPEQIKEVGDKIINSISS